MSTARTKTARTAKTEAAIVQALGELICELPLSKITLTSLAKKSGLTRSTVYNQITSISHAAVVLSEVVWQEVQALATSDTSLQSKLSRLTDFLATDARIQGFRKHNPEMFQEVLASLCRLDNDTYAKRVSDLLLLWAVAADLDTATTLTRWLTSFAVEPGTPRERESASEIFAAMLVMDSRV